MKTSKKEIEKSFRILFQVWEGTEGADEILRDALRTIGHSAFGLKKSQELDEFEKRCRSV